MSAAVAVSATKAELHAMPFVRKLDGFAEEEAIFGLELIAGRLCEVSGEAALSLTISLVLQAQERSEPVAWITDKEHAFYAPDAAANGLDLDALVLAFLPDASSKARAADQLVRSGAFGLVVIDLAAEQRLPPALVTRLLGLAQKHTTAIVFLSGHETALGSLISLRATTRRTRRAHGEFVCELVAVKDKRRAPGWKHEEVLRGPTGLY